MNLLAFHIILRRTCLSLLASVLYSNFSKSIIISNFCFFFSNNVFISEQVSLMRFPISIFS